MTLDLRRESKEGSEKSNDDPRKYLHVHVHMYMCTYVNVLDCQKKYPVPLKAYVSPIKCAPWSIWI